MRVLYAIDGLPGGGAERQLALLLANLPADVEPLVWSLAGGDYAAAIETLGVPLRIAGRGSRLDPRPAAALWNLLRRRPPSLVHAWGWRAAAEAAPACVALRVPLLHGAIRSAFVHHGRTWPPYWSLWAARRVVSNSAAGLAAWGIAPPRGVVIANAFDPARLPAAEPEEGDETGTGTEEGAAPAAEPEEGDETGTGTEEGAAPAGERRGAAAGRLRVIMTGRMSAQKDYRTLLAAARRLEALSPGGWEFVLVGSGPDRGELEAGAGDLVATGAVTFAAPGLEVMPLVAAADVGVLLTDPRHHAEGCSNSIMEYMAAGLPVVCNDSGGNRELVGDGEHAALVPPLDAGAVAGRLDWLAAHPEERRRLGVAGRERLLAEYTPARMVGGYRRLYDELAPG